MAKKLILAIQLFTLIAYSYANGAQDSSPSSVNGTITYLEGDVYINDMTAEIGDSLKSSDVLKTGFDSYCEVVFEDANIFRLDGDTITIIDWSKSDIEIQQGGISAVFNKLDKLLREMKDFTISTPTTVAGIRGTVFYVRTEDENNAYLCICNGELAVNYNDKEELISSDHHKAYRYTKTEEGVSVKSAPLIYHDDPKMDAVAANIDFDIPWDSGNYGY